MIGVPTKRVFIIHGWEGHPENWKAWLKEKLQERGFEAHAPQMPNTYEPTIEEWVSFLAKEIGTPDKDTYLVGHSLGCQAILRYLESLSDDQMVGGVLMVAGFITLRKEIMFGRTEKILGPWIERSIDLSKAKAHSERFVSVFSDNDPFIPLGDSDIFKAKLGSKIIVIPRGGHFSGSEGYSELHVALNEILKMIL